MSKNRNKIIWDEDEENPYCILLGKRIPWGYCWELCNIGTDEILLEGDKVDDWDEALQICKKCGRYED